MDAGCHPQVVSQVLQASEVMRSHPLSFKRDRHFYTIMSLLYNRRACSRADYAREALENLHSVCDTAQRHKPQNPARRSVFAARGSRPPCMQRLRIYGSVALSVGHWVGGRFETASPRQQLHKTRPPHPLPAACRRGPQLMLLTKLRQTVLLQQLGRF